MSGTLAKPITIFSLGAASGTLSQSVANLQLAEDQVRSVGNLPSAAQRIQSHSVTLISKMTSQIESIHGSVGNFVKSALQEFEKIEIMLKSNENLVTISESIEIVETNKLDTIATQVLANIQIFTSTMCGYSNQLSQIETDLTNRTTGLQGKLRDAQSRECAAKKIYSHLSMLGKLGVGLAAALAVYSATKSEVDGYDNEIRSLKYQIVSLNGMKTATNQIETDFQDVVNHVSSVKNAVTFVSNDISKVRSDFSTKDVRLLIELYVNAATAEVKTLSIDALGSVASV